MNNAFVSFDEINLSGRHTWIKSREEETTSQCDREGGSIRESRGQGRKIRRMRSSKGRGRE